MDLARVGELEVCNASESTRYWIAQAVMLRDGEFAGSAGPIVYTAKALHESVDTWKGRPVLLDHPVSLTRGTQNTSELAVLFNDQLVGFVMDAEVRSNESGHELVGTLVLDSVRLKEKASHLHGLLLSGQKTEVSTGLLTSLNEVDGKKIASAIEGDHLALLRSERGACSVHDGCYAKVTDVSNRGQAMDDSVTVRNQDGEGQASAASRLGELAEFLGVETDAGQDPVGYVHELISKLNEVLSRMGLEVTEKKVSEQPQAGVESEAETAEATQAANKRCGCASLINKELDLARKIIARRRKELLSSIANAAQLTDEDEKKLNTFDVEQLECVNALLNRGSATYGATERRTRLAGGWPRSSGDDLPIPPSVCLQDRNK